MAVNAIKFADMTLAPIDARVRRYQRGVQPHIVEIEDGSNCEWAFDFEYDVESPEDMPVVNITALRLIGHDGSEYEIPMRAVSRTWLSGIESEIAWELAGELEAAALALKEGRE